MSEYTDHWITTYTGKKFHYLHPDPDEIDIEDIAHALSLTCRFGGHCREFYSVADHSVRVALATNTVDNWVKLEALLHDAHEAYLHDVPRPIKADIPGYRILANNIQTAIAHKLHPWVVRWLSVHETILVRTADDIVLATEARDLMPNTDGWEKLPPPLPTRIIPLTPNEAETVFLDDYYFYKGVAK